MTALSFAFRSLAKAPGFTCVAVLTLALGIGLNTAMFSVINALILRPLKLPESAQLFRLDRTHSGERQGQHSPANALDLQRDAFEFASLAIGCPWGFTIVLPNRPAESLSAFRVSANFFHTLGVTPLLGRDFRAEDDQPGKNRVILLSHRVWLSHFGGDPQVVGKTVRLDGDSAEIIGVMPPAIGELGLFDFVRIYRPLGLTSEEKANRTNTSYFVYGRYRAGVTEPQAASRFAALSDRLIKDFPRENAETGLHIVTLQSTRVGDVGRKLTLMLLGLSGFVLLIACSNLANLLLARAVSQGREFAIRGALGASRLQLIRPLATECFVLAALGGGLGLLVCEWTMAWMSQRFSYEDVHFNLPFDWRVMSFALIGSFATSLFFGIAPAWLISRIRINDLLKSGARGSTGDRSQHRFRQALIVAQFGLALVLLSGAAAFVRGVDHLLNQHFGWIAEPLISGKIALPEKVADTPDKMLLFYQRAQAKISALPGVAGTAVSLSLPAFGFMGPRGYLVDGQPPPLPGREPSAFTNAVSPEYFDLVATRILRGRGIEPTDTRTSPPVVVINEAMAHALFPRGDAIGHRLGSAEQKDPGWAEIVGVAEDVHFTDVGSTPTAFQVYKPLSEETWGYVSIIVKVEQPATAGTLIQQIRRTFADLSPDLPLQDFIPVPAAIARNMKDFSTINELLVAFALLGLFLAALGIYGVIARMVQQRTGEIGIRMAMGAQGRQVVRLIVGAGIRMVLLGTFLGLIGSVGLAFLLVNTMPGLATNDALGMSFSTALLIVVAFLACWLPARKASRVDPLIALRGE